MEPREYMFFTRVATKKVHGTYRSRTTGEKRVKVYTHKIIRIPPELEKFFEEGEEVLVTIVKVEKRV
ncbi:MAG: hypothetical protein DRO39_08570 [Thermoprotei archaeon]|nr:MAG: hypothetical protein DRO39_08570 [Thermoprotei archaeon]